MGLAYEPSLSGRPLEHLADQIFQRKLSCAIWYWYCFLWHCDTIQFAAFPPLCCQATGGEQLQGVRRALDCWGGGQLTMMSHVNCRHAAGGDTPHPSPFSSTARRTGGGGRWQWSHCWQRGCGQLKHRDNTTMMTTTTIEMWVTAFVLAMMHHHNIGVFCGPYTPSTAPKIITTCRGGCCPSVWHAGVERKASCGVLGGHFCQWRPWSAMVVLVAVGLSRLTSDQPTVGIEKNCLLN